MGDTQGLANSREPVEAAEATERTGTLAYTHPLTDRRRASRHKQMFVTQMTPWTPGHPSIPCDVILEDLSETGAGVIHERPCEVGIRYLLTVPRGEGERPIIREFNAIRCDRRADGTYSVGLELIDGITTGVTGGARDWQRKPVTSPRVKVLFLAFGLACLLFVAFVPL